MIDANLPESHIAIEEISEPDVVQIIFFVERIRRQQPVLQQKRCRQIQGEQAVGRIADAVLGQYLCRPDELQVIDVPDFQLDVSSAKRQIFR